MRRLVPVLRLPATLLLVTMSVFVAQGIEYPGPRPGSAEVSADGSRILMQNQLLSASWHIAQTGFGEFSLLDKQSGSAPPAW